MRTSNVDFGRNVVLEIGLEVYVEWVSLKTKCENWVVRAV